MKNIFTLLILLITANVYSQDLNLGLRAYYPFNGNANDYSGNNNNPIFNNATLTSDQAGTPNSAYHFDGSSTYMQIPNSPGLNMNNQISIAVKVKPMDWYTGQCYNNMMVMKGDGDYLQGNYSSRFSDVYTGCTNPTTINERFNGLDVLAAIDPIIALNNWYNVVCTYDGTEVKMYVNCILRDSVTLNITTFTNSYDLFFGHMNNAQYPFWLNGDLDEVRIYDRALSQSEVNLYGDCTVAPVTITSFDATVINKSKIQLVWKTEAESGIRNYSIERSAISLSNDFVSTGTIASKNNSLSNTYAFTDNNAKPGILYYYRLRINDNDGSGKYSSIKTAKIVSNTIYNVMYPNPTSGIIKVDMNNAEQGRISVINNLGQIVLQRKNDVRNSSPVILDISKEPAGCYWIRIQTDQHLEMAKIIKE